MKTKRLINCIGILVCALALAGCAAAATTANVLPVDAPAALPPEPLEPVAAQADAYLAFAATPEQAGGEEHVVRLSPPLSYEPATPGPEEAATADAQETPPAQAEPSPTPEQTAKPTATPKQTSKPSPTPSYTVEELDEYVDGYVNAGAINLRKGPGTDYEVLGEYERYDELLVTGTCEEWYRVKLDGLRGYMLMEYVTIGNLPTPTPKATEKPKATPTPKPGATPRPEPTEPPAEAPPASTTDEMYLLAQVVYKEGDSESYVAVANVIYNRVQGSSFPDTIYEVIYQKNQFSTSNLKTPSSKALAAVQQIFADRDLILPPEVQYFHAASRGTSRSGYNYYATFGGNAFFYK